MQRLPLSKPVTDALTYKTGELGNLLKDVITYVRGNLNAFKYGAIEPLTASKAYLQAIQWADATASAIHP